MAPRVSHPRDLFFVSEGWENSPIRKFCDTTFATVDTDDTIYFGLLPIRYAEITWDQYNEALKPVDFPELYPELPADAALTIAPEDGLGDVYIKRPQLRHYEEYAEQGATATLRQALLDEAKIMQQISQLAPHPNIVRYHGCRVRRGRITGLVMDKYDHNLTEHFYRKARPLDIPTFVAALKSAVKHLHASGFAHNDVNPANIMVDDYGMPVLIDFDSCCRIGEKLTRGRGTPGWIEGSMDDYITSEASHDIYALHKLREWMEAEQAPKEAADKPGDT